MAEYRFVDGLKLRQKVRAVIISENGDILLVRPHGYASNEWTLAGGGVEQGETVHQAMRREIAEELGVTLEEELDQLPVSNRYIYSADYQAKRSLDHDGQEASMFLVRLPSDSTLKLQAEEIAEARWFSPEEATSAFPVK